jgi:hypothetical protein
LLALAFILTRKRRAQKRVEAEQIRVQASQQVNDVQRREAIAEESAAKARRAQADAEAKAAEAKRLQHEAQSHQGAAASSRQELDAEFQRADKIDPDVKRSGRHEGDHQDPNTGHRDDGIRHDIGDQHGANARGVDLQNGPAQGGPAQQPGGPVQGGPVPQPEDARGRHTPQPPR